MIRARTTLCLGIVFVVQPIIAAEPGHSARQRFVVRVNPTIKVEVWEIRKRSAATIGDATSSPPDTDAMPEGFEAALRVDGAGPAGLLVQFEARSARNTEEIVKQTMLQQFNLRVDTDVQENWSVDLEGGAGKTESAIVQASSHGIGPATLRISGRAAAKEGELVIITTIISKD